MVPTRVVGTITRAQALTGVDHHKVAGTGIAETKTVTGVRVQEAMVQTVAMKARVDGDLDQTDMDPAHQAMAHPVIVGEIRVAREVMEAMDHRAAFMAAPDKAMATRAEAIQEDMVQDPEVDLMEEDMVLPDMVHQDMDQAMVVQTMAEWAPEHGVVPEEAWEVE